MKRLALGIFLVAAIAAITCFKGADSLAKSPGLKKQRLLQRVCPERFQLISKPRWNPKKKNQKRSIYSCAPIQLRMGRAWWTAKSCHRRHPKRGCQPYLPRWRYACPRHWRPVGCCACLLAKCPRGMRQIRRGRSIYYCVWKKPRAKSNWGKRKTVDTACKQLLRRYKQRYSLRRIRLGGKRRGKWQWACRLAPKHGKGVKVFSNRTRCTRKYPQGCVTYGFSWRPRCPRRGNYRAKGCCYCVPQCPRGWKRRHYPETKVTHCQPKLARGKVQG